MENATSQVLLPEENVVLDFEVTADRPFNQCFECRSFRNGCSGPNLFAMGIARACEFLQMARVHQKYSYQDVADATTISIAQVKRILSGKVSDPSYFSLKALSDFLLGDPNGKSPCAFPDTSLSPSNDIALTEATREMERLVNDNEDYRHALDNIHASYQKELDSLRTEHREAMAEKAADFLSTKTHLLQQIEDQRDIIVFLRTEMNRRSALIDTYMKVLPPNGENKK